MLRTIQAGMSQERASHARAWTILNVGQTLVDEYTHIPLFSDMVYNG
jgi:hypothetical protein